MTLPVRPATRGNPLRRTRGPARASAARRSADRVAAVIVLVASLAALGGMVTSGAFALAGDGLEVRGAHYTSVEAVRAALGLTGIARPNLVSLRTGELEATLRALPTVDAARTDAVSVRVALPDRLVVELHERVPIVVWTVGAQHFLADASGTLFAPVPAATGEVAADSAALPEVTDRRLASIALGVGSRLFAEDVAAMRRLAALTPAFLGSGASALALSVDDTEGFAIDAQPPSWHAVFGIYTISVRPPSLVDRQAQCLASVLAGRERTLGTIILGTGTDPCGTYTLRAPGSPAGPSSKPSGSPTSAPSVAP